jgi:hypothetical protein
MAFTSDVVMCKYFWFVLALSAVARVPHPAEAGVPAADRIRRAA